MMKKSTIPTGRSSDKFMLRLPDGMRDTIAELAKSSGRSMNAELVYRIQRTIDEDAELIENGVKILEGMHIDRAALMMPPGTILTPHEIDKYDPRYSPDSVSEQLREVRELLENIRKEMNEKK